MKTLSLLPVTLDGDDTQQKRKEILEYFLNTYELYEKLFEIFTDDSVFYKKSEPTRHPMIFYFGHTATFFINKLILAKVITKRINPDFESIFAVGVDEMSWDDMDEKNYAWPDVQSVREYRAKVKELVKELIMNLPLTLPISKESAFWVILMGIEHERIHIETSSVLHRQLDIEDVKEHQAFLTCKDYSKSPKNELVAVSGARVSLAKDENHHLYGWDNEYGEHSEDVEDFFTSKYLVSNEEFLAFVKDGGYKKERYWDDEGLKFLKISLAEHPPFWIEHGDGFRYRNMCEIIDMPFSWPVDVNALEAMAYCRWLGERDGCDYTLLSEAQWHRLYDVAGIKDVPEFDDKRANINFAHYSSSTPVDRFAFGDIYDVMGNVWQWTRTPIYGFKGFEVHPVYDDFSTPTFDNKHNIIKGGSWATSGNELMRYSRYAFRRHFYQHAGFRYVKGVADTQESDIYESDKAVSLDCEFNYGDTHFAIENFAKKCASLADRYAINRKSALHLGCATGRSCFELARYFESVTGIDFSARFIQMGVTLQKRGEIFYKREEEGDIISYHSHSLKEFDLEKYADKVQFWQGDSCNLKEHFRDYDMIISTNLDRLYEPKLFLESIHKRLNDNGILILISPYLWQEQYTKREFWLGGYIDEHENEVSSFETLKEILQEHLTLLDSQEIESVIRKKARDFQHLISHVSVWRKDV